MKLLDKAAKASPAALKQALKAQRERTAEDFFGRLSQIHTPTEAQRTEYVSGKAEPTELLEYLIGMPLRGGLGAATKVVRQLNPRGVTRTPLHTITKPQIPYPSVDEAYRKILQGEVDSKEGTAQLLEAFAADAIPITSTTPTKVRNLISRLEPEGIDRRLANRLSNIESIQKDAYRDIKQGALQKVASEFVAPAKADYQRTLRAVNNDEDSLLRTTESVSANLARALRANADAKYGNTAAERAKQLGYDIENTGWRGISAQRHNLTQPDQRHSLAVDVLPESAYFNIPTSVRNPNYRYHGTFVEMQDTPVGEAVAQFYADRYPGNLGNTMQVVTKKADTAKLFDPTTTEGRQFLENMLRGQPEYVSSLSKEGQALKTLQVENSKDIWPAIEQRELQDHLRDAGFSGFKTHEYSPGTAAYYNPQGIKSVDAAFDPDLHAIERGAQKGGWFSGVGATTQLPNFDDLEEFLRPRDTK